MSSIAFDKLLHAIATHPVRRHTVFQTLAARKYPPDILTRYLVNMATMSAALRNFNTMRNAFGLWEYGSEAEQFRMRSAYQALKYIDRREKDNEARFQAMGEQLVGKESASTITRYAAPAGNAAERSRLTPGTHAALHVLRHRDSNQADEMFRALGGLFATEIVWYEQVTPGHVAAFVDSGFYGLRLRGVPYLKKLVSVKNKSQEAWMSWMVDKASMTDDEWVLAHEGATETLSSLLAFYDDLEAILKS